MIRTFLSKLVYAIRYSRAERRLFEVTRQETEDEAGRGGNREDSLGARQNHNPRLETGDIVGGAGMSRTRNRLMPALPPW